MGAKEAIAKFLSSGQERRQWLDRQDRKIAEALSYYGGPAAQPIQGIASALAAASPGADMMDMAQSSRDLMQSGGPMEAAKNAGWLGAATLGMALPGNAGALRIERKGKTLADAYADGRFAGTISISEQHPFVSAVNVEPDFRGKGIGRALYEEAEAMAGRPLVPSPLGLTEDAARIWRRRLERMDPEAADRIINEAWEIGRSYGIRDEHLTPRLSPLRPNRE